MGWPERASRPTATEGGDLIRPGSTSALSRSHLSHGYPKAALPSLPAPPRPTARIRRTLKRVVRGSPGACDDRARYRPAIIDLELGEHPAERPTDGAEGSSACGWQGKARRRPPAPTNALDTSRQAAHGKIPPLQGAAGLRRASTPITGREKCTHRRAGDVWMVAIAEASQNGSAVRHSNIGRAGLTGVGLPPEASNTCSSSWRALGFMASRRDL